VEKIIIYLKNFLFIRYIEIIENQNFTTSNLSLHDLKKRKQRDYARSYRLHHPNYYYQYYQNWYNDNRDRVALMKKINYEKKKLKKLEQ